MKTMNKKVIYRIITAIWICIIFSFSLQVADKSTVLSDGVGELILEHASTETINESRLWTESEWKLFHKIIRKCGHFAEFFVLGILMMLNMYQSKFKRKYITGIFLCMLVALTDETIQLFVPGRAGMITDVILDMFGSIVGMYSYILISSFLRKKNI